MFVKLFGVHISQQMKLTADLGALTAEPVGARSVSDSADRRVGWAAAWCALALHGAAFCGLSLAPPPEAASGAGGQYLEAINVEIVLTRVIESRDAARTDDAANASRGPLAEAEGDQSKSATATRKAQPEPRPEPAPANENTAEAIKSLPNERRELQARNAGGVVARSEEDESRGNGPASASPGAMQKYAALVRAVLAKNKPEGRGRPGTVTITFAISMSGTIAFARMSDSSGNRAFDEAVLNAVLATIFPAPPDGMTDAQRTYVIPFHFK
jgi:TonB family protein